MQKKLTAEKRANEIPSADQKNQEPREEELNNWPNGLLSIGTFGYKDDISSHEPFELVERSLDIEIPREEDHPLPDFAEFTTDEVRMLQKELTKLLRQKSTSKAKDSGADHLSLDRFLNCPSSLEVTDHDLDLDSDYIDRTIEIILGRCKDVCREKKRAIRKKSLCLLIKKMFVCGNGFASTPSLKNAFHQIKRTMQTKKINPTNSYEGRLDERNGGGFKWDKTDSEYIVLEI